MGWTFLWAAKRWPTAVGLCAAVMAAAAHAATPPPPLPPGTDPDTAAWWTLTAHLADDDMEGRDTGSAGYARAAAYVVDRFKAAGLRPAGDDGSWYQSVPLSEVRVESVGTRFDIVRQGAPATSLTFLHDISVRPTDALPETLEGPLSFRGYCGPADIGAGMAGKIAVCFGGRRSGAPGAATRLKAAADAGALGLIVVDDPGFTIEPARWPEAYARSITIRGDAPPPSPNVAVMRLSAAAFADLIQGSGQDPAAILAAGSASRQLPIFDIPARLSARFILSQQDFTADNVLALLPGTDPALKTQTVVVSAHLDGYGFGEPVFGDDLYNGAFDDAAYVATLIRLAEQRQGQGFRRSVLFAAFTGEEKGLLGATWFTRHPTVPKADLAADINLDQLRPLFPLKILTMHAVDDTTLGDTVRSVAGPMGIEIRADREPDRHLLERADHWPFLKIGVPATGFVFGYDPGTEAERRYREWYQIRYHRPQDDMTQPIDFQAAADFNTFFYRLTAAVADADQRPAFLPGSAFRPTGP
jgi:Zn-dependent M28 family amino/carboxypeptidase